MGRGPNFTVIPNDWQNLEYIISDLCNRIINEDASFTDYLLADGTRSLSADWNATHKITSANFVSDIATGTKPYACDSITLNTNLNADLLDGSHAAAFQAAGTYLSNIVEDTTPQLGGDLSGQSLYDLTGMVDGTFSGLGTFGELNVASAGSAGAKLAIGMSGDLPAYPGLCEVASSTTNLIPNTLNAAISVDAYFNSTLSQPSNFGFTGSYFLYPTQSSGTPAANFWIGLFGGVSGAINNTQSASGLKSVTLTGLQFNATNYGNWTPTGTAGTAIITARGLYVTGGIGAATYTISGSKAKAVGYGANIDSSIAGYYNAGQAGFNYGAYIATQDVSDSTSTGSLTNYTLYIAGFATKTKGGGGVYTSWDIYQANAVNNALYGKTSFGGVTVPTYNVDVLAGSVNTLGTTGNTYRWNAATTAPSTSVGVAIVNYYGSSATNFLGDPTGWALINVNGSDVKVPYY